MKTNPIILALVLSASMTFGIFPAHASLEVSAGVSIHAAIDFYEPLTAHGAWVEVRSYGRCWHPAGVAAGWRPYCSGSWQWTDCGWYWESDEPWAWACYHYGTWYFDANDGWVWVPGVEWAPAWVNWRMGGDHIGWAPCGPAGFVVAPSLYVFVENRHFHEPVRPNTVIINDTTVINSTKQAKSARKENRQFDGKSQTVVVNGGPKVSVVEKASGQKIAAASVRDVDRRTSVSIPEKLRPGNVGAAPGDKQKSVQEQPKAVPEVPRPAPAQTHELTPENSPKKELPMDKPLIPEKVVPQVPPERTIPPEHKELPLQKNQPHVNEIKPPVHPPVLPVHPVVPPVNREQSGDGHDEGRDQDHGHDKP